MSPADIDAANLEFYALLLCIVGVFFLLSTFVGALNADYISSYDADDSN